MRNEHTAPDYNCPPPFGPIAYWKKPTGDKRLMNKLLKELEERRATDATTIKRYVV